jgi:hypothetical protein
VCLLHARRGIPERIPAFDILAVYPTWGRDAADLVRFKCPPVYRRTAREVDADIAVSEEHEPCRTAMHDRCWRLANLSTRPPV